MRLLQMLNDHCWEAKRIVSSEVWHYLNHETERILFERNILHEYLEKQAEWALQGERAAQKRGYLRLRWKWTEKLGKEKFWYLFQWNQSTPPNGYMWSGEATYKNESAPGSHRKLASGRTDSNKKAKYACIVETHESTRKRLECTLPRNHEDHIAEKGFNSVNHCNWVHKLILVPQAMKIPGAKAALDKDWEQLEKLPVWQIDKVKSKRKMFFWKHKKRKGKSPLLHWWTSVISRMRS